MKYSSKQRPFRAHSGTRVSALALAIFALSLVLFACGPVVFAQTEEEIGNGEDDPIKLFEQGQDAHARGDLSQALQLYDDAIKLRPEFPEAEYQRATALITLNRLPEAEKALQRSIELRPAWARPVALLGDLLTRQKKYVEAERVLAQALKLEPQNATALIAWAELRLGTKASRELLVSLLGQLRSATALPDSSSLLWTSRGTVERSLGDTQAAIASFGRALAIDPKNVHAYIERAEAFASAGDLTSAIESAKAAQQISPASIYASTSLARIYLQSGNCSEAARTLDKIDAVTKRPAETASLRSVVTMECATGDKEKATLEEALVKDPLNLPILSRLCTLNRKDDPQRSLTYCRRALELEPSNPDLAVGYAAALVQVRRFPEAVALLQKVIASVPDSYTAHSNLAIALYELKRYQEALVEYRWILAARPDNAVTHFFIATAHDNLREFPEAQAAYETFLARADPSRYQLEIDKVNLRLPSLRRQIKLGQGAKKKS